jgi:hypothetical protein
LVGNEACHGVAAGEAGHPPPRLYQVENYALASQSSITLGISPSVTRRLRRRCPAQISGWPYANHPPSSTPFGSGHSRSLWCGRKRPRSQKRSLGRQRGGFWQHSG